MSTVSQTRKITVARITENRVLSLLLVAAFLAMMAVLIKSVAVPDASGSFVQNTPSHRQWTPAEIAAGLEIYHLSERTLFDPQAGMAIYHESERTRLPVQFNPYQRSEWFGE